MSAVSQASKSVGVSNLNVDVSNLTEQVHLDVGPWKETADKVRIVLLCLEYFVFDQAPSDIDLFKYEENEAHEYVYYPQTFSTSVTAAIGDLASGLKILGESIQKFADSITDPSTSKTLFKVTVSVINGANSLQTFEYPLK